MRPLIGYATLSKALVPPSTASKFANNESYARAIVDHGGAPIMIPSTCHEEALVSVYEVLDGLLLSGGPDIDPQTFYGAAPHEKLGPVDHAMDETERYLIQRALADDLPILGICRGIQILNAVAGGSLYQDIDAQYGETYPHAETNSDRSYLAHTVTVEQGTRLAALLDGDTLPGSSPSPVSMGVNTLHHQAVRDVAPGFVVNARADDGLIEGLEHPQRAFVVGLQCHPEELYGHQQHWSRVFSAFIEAADQRRKQRGG